MRTAAKSVYLPIALIGVLLHVSANAQTFPAAVSGGVSSASPVVSGPEPVASPQSAKAPLPVNLSGANKKNDKEVEEEGGGKIPASVDNVVKRLNEATEKVTLEDLNAAREAAAKLDVLIDIEKKLSDLTRIRTEREEKANAAFASAIPASALGLKSPPAMAGQIPVADISPSVPVHPVVPVVQEPQKIEVMRISGVGGSYIATIKSSDADRETKIVKSGDKLADGSVVSGISKSGVTVTLGKKSMTYPVRDVARIFGS